ncbi:hypothetical protein O9G_002259 [Rozella allomycis CSF55]|uniref:Uncharacterized protein n=1 Tax=Rozella allomycis (strain CSF55) TaxID=988480 RepID=A0A075B1G2_ROZAC|nr:hypothetical protein O9G_002259 [Rozella allomycis CSF55]|eukprot:EPZ36193.1 hypothetical protein O9G_002259 [Rozella allomycis CSF55]
MADAAPQIGSSIRKYFTGDHVPTLTFAIKMKIDEITKKIVLTQMRNLHFTRNEKEWQKHYFALKKSLRAKPSVWLYLEDQWFTGNSTNWYLYAWALQEPITLMNPLMKD